ncbi:MAG: hypothetical protein Q7S00_07245, partial [bacterium]|nr:hypothetical protein [bacterium]
MDFSQERVRDFQDRFVYCIAAVTFFFIILILRVGYLQIVKGNYFRSFSNEFTVKETKEPATRGLIYDRFGKILTDNRPSYDIVVVPQYVRFPEKMMEGLSRLADLPRSVSVSLWTQAQKGPSFYQYVFKKDVPLDTVSKILSYRSAESVVEDEYDFSGVEVFAHPTRFYPLKDLSGITLGYVGEISSEKLKRYRSEGEKGYSMGDEIGVSGLEKSWEKYLRGQDGYEQRIVDATGRVVTTEDLSSLLHEEEAVSGNHLVTTLDLDLQSYA